VKTVKILKFEPFFNVFRLFSEISEIFSEKNLRNLTDIKKSFSDGVLRKLTGEKQRFSENFAFFYIHMYIFLLIFFIFQKINFLTYVRTCVYCLRNYVLYLYVSLRKRLRCSQNVSEKHLFFSDFLREKDVKI